MIALAESQVSETTLSARRIAGMAVEALRREVKTWPKPGLVSHVDSGSHTDMDAATLDASAEALRPFFLALAEAGAADAGMNDLRRIGRAAERSMLAATGGVNTHRGALFTLGLLCAAAGALGRAGGRVSSGGLGGFVRCRWGRAILRAPLPGESHGTGAWRRYGAGGVRAEAADGFPHVYRVGLPALRTGNLLSGGDGNAASVHACFALIAELEDTNVLHRGGTTGLRFAQGAARSFLARGGVGRKDWPSQAEKIHRHFVARRLSPGGSADLLAATLLINALETPETHAKDWVAQLNLKTENQSLCSPSF